MSDTEEIANKRVVQGFSIVLIVFSIMQLGFSLAAYLFLASKFRFGAWWGAILVFASGALGIVSCNKCTILTACVFACLGTIVALTALIIDGIGLGVVSHMKACYSPQTDTSYGNGHGYGDEQKAISCFNDTNVNHKCYCYDGKYCWDYQLSEGNDCGEIFTTYTSDMRGSVAMLALCFFSIMVFTVLMCVSCCLKKVQKQDAEVYGTNTSDLNAPLAAAYTPSDYQPTATAVVVDASNPKSEYNRA